MKYIIIVAIISIAGAVSNINNRNTIQVEYIDFEPMTITVKA